MDATIYFGHLGDQKIYILWPAFRHVFFRKNFITNALISKFPCKSPASVRSHNIIRKSKDTYTRKGEMF